MESFLRMRLSDGPFGRAIEFLGCKPRSLLAHPRREARRGTQCFLTARYRQAKAPTYQCKFHRQATTRAREFSLVDFLCRGLLGMSSATARDSKPKDMVFCQLRRFRRWIQEQKFTQTPQAQTTLRIQLTS